VPREKCEIIFVNVEVEIEISSDENYWRYWLSIRSSWCGDRKRNGISSAIRKGSCALILIEEVRVKVKEIRRLVQNIYMFSRNLREKINVKIIWISVTAKEQY